VDYRPLKGAAEDGGLRVPDDRQGKKLFARLAGDSVEVYELDAGRLIMKGLSLYAPAQQVEAAAEIEIAEESATEDEGLTDGND
jgi:hypothetical protein